MNKDNWYQDILETIKFLIKGYKTTWVVKVEFNKNDAKFYPEAPKSKNHKGNKINNTYMQLILTQRSMPMFDQIRGEVYLEYPKASNFNFTEIRKVC